MKFYLFVFFSISLFLLNSSCHAQAKPAQLPSGPLGDFDATFLEEYTFRISAIAQARPTYIEISGNNLILHREGGEESARVLTDIYHALKDVAHVPLTAYLELSQLTATDREITPEQLAHLQELSIKILSARNALQTGHFNELQLIRQQQIVDETLDLLRDSIQQKRINRSTLKGYARSMGPLLMENSDEGGCYQVKEMHSQMMRWKSVMTQDEWNHLVAVNKSSHQPRYRNVATQYFGWLFDAFSPKWVYPGESERLVYAESLPKGLDAEDVLITLSIDADLSSAFFNDRWRLSEDILSDGAAQCIAQLPIIDRTWRQ